MGLPRAQLGRGARWVQVLAAVLLGIASTRVDTSIPPPNHRNRANRHWRWRAYHTCRARSRVRLARVASILGALSERDAGPPAARRSFLRSTLTKLIVRAAKTPATLSRFFQNWVRPPRTGSVGRGTHVEPLLVQRAGPSRQVGDSAGGNAPGSQQRRGQVGAAGARPAAVQPLAGVGCVERGASLALMVRGELDDAAGVWLDTLDPARE